MSFWQRVASCVVASIVICGPSDAWAVEVQPYRIVPGGTYVYLPPPEGPGIPGCDPSDYECGFGIGGEFSVEFDTVAETARFTSLDLMLTGNEDIQSSPPLFGQVTTARVEDWLAGRTFELESVGALINVYVDSELSGLVLTDFFDGNLTLAGGYNNTPVDGDGLNFNFMAALIPEPGALTLAVAGLLVALGTRTARSEIAGSRGARLP